MSTPCAIWLRVSDDSQNEENQLPALRRFCAHHDLEIVQTYTLHDQSAYKGEHRATLELAKSAAYRGEFQVIVVWALDRICREGVEELLKLVRELRERKCALMSVQEPWCSGSDAATELLISITAWMGKQESARKSERVKAGMARARAEGKQIGGRKAGATDRKPRDPEVYRKAWERRKASQETGGSMNGMFSDTESPVLHGIFEVRAEHVLAADPGTYGSALELMLIEEGYTNVLVDELRVTMADADGLEWTAPVSPELQAWMNSPRPGEITMTLVCRDWLELRG